MPQITVTKRTSMGSAESRRMRRSGYVPAVIYGRGGKEDLLAVRETEYMKTIGFRPTGIVSLQGLGKPVSVLIKEVQWDPLTDKPLHIDFYRVALDQIVSVKVGLHARGTPKGALFGGVTELDYLPDTISGGAGIDVLVGKETGYDVVASVEG